MNRSISFCSWNVRGLNDSIKCGNVLAELLSALPDVVLLQETKLQSISPFKLRSFLPRRLHGFSYNSSNGSAGGILTAWNSTTFTLVTSASTPHTITSHLSTTSSDLSLFITNVYAPTSPEFRPSFLEELASISPNPSSPWLLLGDFNMICYPHEKNNDNFHQSEVEAFNDCINSMCLIELPLIDRQYTWSNNCSTPTVERLDRAFINLAWDAILPNSIISSLTRRTSDHVPLILNISTHIPKARLFRFENCWVHRADFRDTVHSAWHCRTRNSDPAGVLAEKLKATKRALKLWNKQHLNVNQQENDCHLVINLLDRIEEHRSLSIAEANLRSVIITVLSRTTRAKLLLWKQRAKIRAAVDGDENTRFFHACANQRRRKNNIQVIEHDDREVHGHGPKAAILHDFYQDLLGANRPIRWGFCLQQLYPEDSLSLTTLDGEFDQEEIMVAFRQMNSNASPEPNGFGPLFFKHNWSCVREDIAKLFSAFYCHDLDLSRIDRSYLVLLPKKDGAHRPQDFRPIALQNTTLKGISRVLMNRLQPIIPSLISFD